ncbi:hypothetical protein DFH28DRAFT_1122926 [Melampsora americana]|nr:hypothetical protein DFH28DRAFT_1122926 [Melampsora americana]
MTEIFTIDKTQVFPDQIEVKQAEPAPWAAQVTSKKAALDLATSERNLILQTTEDVKAAQDMIKRIEKNYPIKSHQYTYSFALKVCHSLELASKNLIAGSVRMVYAGFGMSIGSDFYYLLDPNAQSIAAMHATSQSYSLMGSFSGLNGTLPVMDGKFTLTNSSAGTNDALLKQSNIQCYWNPEWECMVIGVLFLVPSGIAAAGGRAMTYHLDSGDSYSNGLVTGQ